jgi:YidC/Oxa1 family membrane protein insertase
VDPFSFPPLAALATAALHGLTALTDLLSPLLGGGAAAAAVVVVTVAVRALLVPAGIAQARAEQARARLAPRLRELQARFRRNPERLQRETMQLYRDENVSPLAGCLPLLVQAPVVGLLYAVFLHPSLGGTANDLLTHTVLGVPLGTGLVSAMLAGTADAVTYAVTGGLVALVAVVGEVTRRLFRPPAPVEGVPSLPRGVFEVLPFATAAIAAFVPLAAGLYLLVTAVWTLVQRLLLRRRYPLPAGGS